jgi:hypothetical protein
MACRSHQQGFNQLPALRPALAQQSDINAIDGAKGKCTDRGMAVFGCSR